MSVLQKQNLADRDPVHGEVAAADPILDRGLAGANTGRAALIQRKRAERAAAADATAVEAASGSSGSRLPNGVQAKMEGSMGHDFSDVRVHEDSSAAAVGANAYARGTDVHFAPGQYNPGSEAGQALIGHELAHVVQQSSGRVAPTMQASGLAVNDSPALEAEADRVGALAAKGESAPVPGAGMDSKGRGPTPLQAKSSVVQMDKNGKKDKPKPKPLPKEEVKKKEKKDKEKKGTKGREDTEADHIIEVLSGVAATLEEANTIIGWLGAKVIRTVIGALGLAQVYAHVGDMAKFSDLIKGLIGIGGASLVRDLVELEKKTPTKEFTKRVKNQTPESVVAWMVGKKPGLIPEGKKKKKDVEKQAKESANPARAKRAMTELTSLASKDKHKPKRLKKSIIKLLVWGVGTAMNETALGKEGIIGIHHAKNAAQALIKMPYSAYTQIVAQIVMSGDPANAKSSAHVESILILKAVAARKHEFTKGKEGEAGKEVGEFAEAIRGKDADQLKKDTSTRDHGDGKGLQQKFTMTCGPTSIQITRGESDPVSALKISKDNKHNLNYKTSTGKEQKDFLGKDHLPRLVEKAWKHTYNPKIKARVKSHPADIPKLVALDSWIKGNAFDAAKLAGGKAWANGAGMDNDTLSEFKKYYPFNEPGWQNSEFQGKANSEIKKPTNSKFKERAIPPKYKSIAGKMRPVSTMKKADTNMLYRRLFRGRDIPLGIMWYGGGGHFMVFTDCKTETVGGKKVRYFMVSDPWEGTSAWVTEKNVLKGDLSPFGKGAIDSIYL